LCPPSSHNSDSAGNKSTSDLAVKRCNRAGHSTFFNPAAMAVVGMGLDNTPKAAIAKPAF
jgi:hypothetical protein